MEKLCNAKKLKMSGVIEKRMLFNWKTAIIWSACVLAGSLLKILVVVFTSNSPDKLELIRINLSTYGVFTILCSLVIFFVVLIFGVLYRNFGLRFIIIALTILGIALVASSLKILSLYDFVHDRYAIDINMLADGLVLTALGAGLFDIYHNRFALYIFGILGIIIAVGSWKGQPLNEFVTGNSGINADTMAGGVSAVIFALALMGMVRKKENEKKESKVEGMTEKPLIYIPGKPNYTSIKLQTREGNDIENSQDHEISLSALRLAPDIRKEFPGAYIRTKPNPIYNCHGRTFASSRTWIGPKSISEILDDDGYSEVSANEILPGDVVILYDYNGEITHTASVVSAPQGNVGKFPWVVSKWGFYGEFYHLLYDCPGRPFAKVTYWRITK